MKTSIINGSEVSRLSVAIQSNTEWIVSVGMISEGTDIPRLQVCCHLSSVKTELYFRQVLGRILRVNESENQEAWLFTMATNELTLFSNRLAEDLPEDYKIMQQQSDDWLFPTIDSQSMPPEFVRKNGMSKIKGIDLEMDIGEITTSSPTISSQTKQLKMSSMHQQVIDAFLFSMI